MFINHKELLYECYQNYLINPQVTATFPVFNTVTASMHIDHK